jgi:NADPH:quinone reductase-like Zn-dependent oxidoreductase
VVVYGATGAVGSAAVQVAKSLGAWVTAVCATAQVDLVRSLGADRVVDYTTEDFTRDTQAYDMVFDAAGKSSFLACRRLLKPQGRYLSTGEAHLATNLGMLVLTTVARRRRVVFPVPRYDVQTLGFIRRLLDTGELRPVVDRTYPLDQIVDAYRYVETGQKIGNVVITVVPEGPPLAPPAPPDIAGLP